MKKTTLNLVLGFLIMIAGFAMANTSVERILPASLFILSAVFYIETARLLLIKMK